MSSWRHVEGDAKHFYGHIFNLSNEGIKKIEKDYHFRSVPRRHRNTTRRFGKSLNRKKRKMGRRLRNSSLKAFHKLRYDDIINQRMWFTKLQKTNKRSPTGIFNSIRYTKRSDYEYTVGQNKYYTHYLLHGNEDGARYVAWDTFQGEAITPTHGEMLHINPDGRRGRMLVRYVRPYASEGNYILNSYNELKPWLNQKYKKNVWITVSGAAQE